MGNGFGKQPYLDAVESDSLNLGVNMGGPIEKTAKGGGGANGFGTTENKRKEREQNTRIQAD